MNIPFLIDLGVVLVLLISAGVSFFRGFIREVLTIFGMIGGLFVAFLFGRSLQPLVRGWCGVVEGKDPEKLFDIIPMTIVADVSAYAGLFLVVFIVLQLVSHFLSGAAHAVGLGTVDRTLGVFFGILRGVLLLGILYLPFHLILSDDRKEGLSSSKSYFYLEGLATWLANFMPEMAEGKGTLTQESSPGTRDKLKALDVLGTEKNQEKKEDSSKEESSGAPFSTPPSPGYDAQDRKGIENLMMDEGFSPAPRGTKGFNE